MADQLYERHFREIEAEWVERFQALEAENARLQAEVRDQRGRARF